MIFLRPSGNHQAASARGAIKARAKTKTLHLPPVPLTSCTVAPGFGPFRAERVDSR